MGGSNERRRESNQQREGWEKKEGESKTGRVLGLKQVDPSLIFRVARTQPIFQEHLCLLFWVSGALGTLYPPTWYSLECHPNPSTNLLFVGFPAQHKHIIYIYIYVYIYIILYKINIYIYTHIYVYNIHTSVACHEKASVAG